MRRMRQWTIDAFASGPFRGNPACVVEPFGAWPEAAWMQALAAENNQAETAFLLRAPRIPRGSACDGSPHGRGSRSAATPPWPAAHALFAELGLDSEAIQFDTLSGPLDRRADRQRYRMNFPADPPKPVATPEGGSPRRWVRRPGSAGRPVSRRAAGQRGGGRGQPPDLAALASAGAGVHQPARSRSPRGRPGRRGEPSMRWSAAHLRPGRHPEPRGHRPRCHCLLSPLFIERLGRARLRFHQAYPGRGGELECEAAGERVLLAGRAVTVIESRLRL